TSSISQIHGLGRHRSLLRAPGRGAEVLFPEPLSPRRQFDEGRPGLRQNERQPSGFQQTDKSGCHRPLAHLDHARTNNPRPSDVGDHHTPRVSRDGEYPMKLASVPESLYERIGLTLGLVPTPFLDTLVAL